MPTVVLPAQPSSFDQALRGTALIGQIFQQAQQNQAQLELSRMSLAQQQIQKMMMEQEYKLQTELHQTKVDMAKGALTQQTAETGRIGALTTGIEAETESRKATTAYTQAQTEHFKEMAPTEIALGKEKVETEKRQGRAYAMAERKTLFDLTYKSPQEAQAARFDNLFNAGKVQEQQLALDMRQEQMEGYRNMKAAIPGAIKTAITAATGGMVDKGVLEQVAAGLGPEAGFKFIDAFQNIVKNRAEIDDNQRKREFQDQQAANAKFSMLAMAKDDPGLLRALEIQAHDTGDESLGKAVGMMQKYGPKSLNEMISIAVESGDMDSARLFMNSKYKAETVTSGTTYDPVTAMPTTGAKHLDTAGLDAGAKQISKMWKQQQAELEPEDVQGPSTTVHEGAAGPGPITQVFTLNGKKVRMQARNGMPMPTTAEELKLLPVGTTYWHPTLQKPITVGKEKSR